MAERKSHSGGGKGRPPRREGGGPRPPGGPKRGLTGASRKPKRFDPKGKPPRGGRPDTRPARAQRTPGPNAEKGERLQKVLAQAGLGSRRACEEFILQGRVTVDGKTVKELGARVDPDRAAIALDGEKLKAERHVYYAVHKPKGYVSTNEDPAGRPRVVDLLPEVPERVYTVGRLDEESTGLMLLTNDGQLANKLAHPRYGVEKIYRAVVAGAPSPEVLDRLTEGVWLSDGKVRARRARVIGARGEATVLELVLAEGKKREIRRMLAKFGHKVMTLTRIAIGPITLKGIPVGDARPLTRIEVDQLRKVASGMALAPSPRDLPRDPRPRGRGPSQGRDRKPPRREGPPPGPSPPAEGRGRRPEIDVAALGPPPSQRPGRPPQGRAEEEPRHRAGRSPSGVRPPRQRFEDGGAPPPRPAGPGRPGYRPEGPPSGPRDRGHGRPPEGPRPPRPRFEDGGAPPPRPYGSDRPGRRPEGPPPAPRGRGPGRPSEGPPPRPAAARPQGPGPRPPASGRPPRPEGPPPSQRPPQGPPPVPMAKGRRVIGLDAKVHREVVEAATPGGPPRRALPKRKPPRKAAGVKRKRPGADS